LAARSKEAAKSLALEVRQELGLDALDPVDPRLLAQEYGIPILTISALDQLHPITAAYLAGTDGMFSAALVPVGTSKFIVDNDAHAPTRRRASLSHEMAHVLWEHSFTEVLINTDGCRAVHPDVETEADRLGQELLISTAATRHAATRGWTDQQVADTYGVSLPYARMRMNLSFARVIHQRSRAKRGRG
jgi:Zn-dependent peptidase ImmA (M78 family)